MANRGLYISPADRKALVGLSKSAHLVFYCYVSYRNRDTWEAWPKISTVSDRTGISRNTINNTIPKLKERKLLQFVGKVKGFICRYRVGVYRSSKYRGGYYMPLDILNVLRQAKGGIAFDVFLLLAQKGYAKDGRSISITRADIVKSIGASKGRVTKALTQLKELNLLEKIESSGAKPRYRIGESVLQDRRGQDEKSTGRYNVDLKDVGPLGGAENDTDLRSAHSSKMTQEDGFCGSKRGGFNGFSDTDKKARLTLVENDTTPSRKWFNPSSKMTQPLVENDTHNKSKNKSLNISLNYKGGTPPLQDRDIVTSDYTKKVETAHPLESYERVSKLTTLNQQKLWIGSLFERHGQRHGWKYDGLDPFMDLHAEIDWEGFPEDIAWFASCLKEIDVWLNRTYQGKKQQIWSGYKWIGGINKWLFRNRKNPPRTIKESSLSVDAYEREKAQDDDLAVFSAEVLKETREAQELYDAAPTEVRHLNLYLRRGRSYEETMEELRWLIRDGEISHSICMDIKADEGLSGLFELIETSGYFEDIMGGKYG